MSCVDMPPSDAIIFFGATGDLAYKQIFPALQALVSAMKSRATILIVTNYRNTADETYFDNRQTDSSLTDVLISGLSLSSCYGSVRKRNPTPGSEAI